MGNTDVPLRSCWVVGNSGRLDQASPCSRWKNHHSSRWNTWLSMSWYIHLDETQKMQFGCTALIMTYFALSSCFLPLFWSQPSLTTLTSLMVRDELQRGSGKRRLGRGTMDFSVDLFKSQSQSENENITAPAVWQKNIEQKFRPGHLQSQSDNKLTC